jgi:hypothetical protein
VTKAASSRGPSRSLISVLLSGADRYASRPLAVIVVVAMTGTWVVVSIVAGFPARWETIFETVVASDDEFHAAGHQHQSVRQAAVDDEAEAE